MGAHAFIDRLLPAPVGGGCRMAGYYLWGSTVIRGEDGRYHMFVTRWPTDTGRDMTASPTAGHYGYSEICRAAADTPEGPYAFEQVVLARREDSWDSVSCHNPAIVRFADTYVLYYCGYSGRKQIGYATAPSVYGPWQRIDQPIFPADVGNRNNPCACVTPDGDLLVVFRAESMRLYAARAASYEGPYRVHGQPLFEHPTEDPCVWHNGECFEMVVEDNVGHYTGSRLNGIHVRSDDGFRWTPMDPILAYGHPIRMDDGSCCYGRQEKPWVLVGDDGVPTHLFLVKAESDPDTPPTYAGELAGQGPVWNVCLPMRPCGSM